jgi:signal transduction histidine kinase
MVAWVRHTRQRGGAPFRAPAVTGLRDADHLWGHADRISRPAISRQSRPDISLRRMTLRARLAAGLLAIAVVLVAPLGLALRSLEDLHQSALALRNKEFAASLLLGRIRVGTEDLRRAEDALLFVHDSASERRMSHQISTLEAMADSLQSFSLDSAASNLRRAVTTVASVADREYGAALARHGARADSLSANGVRPAISEMERWISAGERSLRERTRDRVAAAADAAEQARQFAAAVLVFAALLATAIAVWLTHSISGPVQDLETGMEAVASGDFSHRLSIAPHRHDEFGRLASSYAAMARQLTELDKLKAEFVSVASHELKTPVNVLLGYLQLLQDGVYGPLSERQREVCHTLETQCLAIGRLVKQLLDVSRFEAGGGKLEARPIVLKGFLDELEASFRVLAHQRGVEFVVRREAELPTEVVWDADRISEVLGNLLSNAFKFTPDGGRVRLSVQADGKRVQMEVRDTGAGIPAEQLPRIFEKFYRADNQPAAADGTGLGLAIAKNIVEAHRGTIGVDSTPGIGTTFSISLPVALPLRRQRPTAPHGGRRDAVLARSAG